MADEKVFKIRIDGVEKSYEQSAKLLNVLVELNKTVGDISTKTINTTKVVEESTRSSKEKTKSLTDEEKAQKKLADTQAKANREITALEKEQAKANLQLRERTRYLSNLAKLEAAAADSPKAIKAEIALLNQEWDNLAIGTEEFDKLTQKIDELNTKIKNSEFSKGQFGRNVGNYPQLIGDLNSSFANLASSTDNVTKSARGMFSLFQAGIGISLIFDENNEGLSKTMNQLGKVLAAVGAIQAFNNEIIKSGTAASIANSAIEKVRAIQIQAAARATALQTKNTIAATVAQRAFNLVARANPYLLIATGIAAVVGALVGYSRYTDDATESTQKYKSSLDGVIFSTKEARDAHDNHLQTIRNLALDYDVLTGKVSSYQAEILKIDYSQQDAEMEARKKFAEEIFNIESEYNKKIEDTRTAIDPFGGNLRDAIKLVEERDKKLLQIETDFQDNLSKIRIQADINRRSQDAKTNEESAKLQEQAYIETLKGQERDLAQLDATYQERYKKANELGIATTDLDISYQRQRQEIQERYAKEYTDRERTRYQTTLQYARQYEDLITKSISSENERRRTEINISYERQIEDLKRTLETDKTLSTEARKSINDIILELEIQRKAALEKLDIESNKDQLARRKKLLDSELASINNFYNQINAIEVKDKNGFIDTDATRKNLEDANKNLQIYLNDLQHSRDNISAYYDDLLKLYNEDSDEYKIALQEKTNALANIDKQTATATKSITDNTKKETDLQKVYWEQLADKIQEIADRVMNVMTSVFDAANSIIQMELDDANAKYEEISSKYDEIVQKREESTQRIQELEEQAQNARGGRALVIQSQIEREMEANKKLAEQEKQLAKDKEKQEKEIAKRERQQKRLQLTQNIAQAIANTALGITQAVAASPLTGGLPWSAIIAAIGALQVGVMTSQLAKLEDGGLLKGKRHSDGGMRVEGTNIEVEGGEYVVNRESTNKNLGLIKYINSQRRRLNADDVTSFMSTNPKLIESPYKGIFENGGQMPIMTNTNGVTREDLITIADTIQGINIEPVVSVVDINNAQSETVKLEDYSGL